jgi:hypothetical protein
MHSGHFRGASLAISKTSSTKRRKGSSGVVNLIRFTEGGTIPLRFWYNDLTFVLRATVIAFEVSINGKRMCTAGIADFGVLSAILSWARRRPENSRDGKDSEEELTFEVGGLDNSDAAVSEHLNWLATPLQVGDTVSIRVIEPNEVEAPGERRRQDPDAIAEAKRRYYEQLKREYDG